MSPLAQSGFESYALLFLAGALMTEPWRWLGVWLARDLDIDSELFRWAKAVSTALVAGLVSRLVLFPSGALEGVPLALRLAAFALGIAAYFLFGRILAVGVLTSVGALLLGGSLL